MTAQPNAGLQNDAAAEADLLGFEPYTLALVDAIATSPPPFTMGIFGEWGCGKTTLMRFIQARLDSNANAIPVRTIWFNAWKYSDEAAIWNALLRTVFRAMEAQGIASRNAMRREAFLNRVKSATRRASGLAVKIGARVLTAGAVTDEDLDKASKLLESNGPDWNRVDERAKLEEEFKVLVAEFVGADGRMVVFVDDLDRCDPAQAIGVLEAMKFFFDHDNCMFVIGADRVVLEAYIDHKYQDIKPKSGRDYLEKLIQLPFNMSAIDPEPALKILKAFGGIFSGASESFGELVLAGTYGNPRRVKRFANIFVLLTRLRPLGGGDEPATAAFAILLQMRFPAYFEAFARDATDFHSFVKLLAMDSRDREVRFQDNTRLREMFHDAEFKAFVAQTISDINEQQLGSWLRFTQRVVS